MYQKLLKWCKDSEVILASRVQVLGGVLMAAVTALLPLLSEQNLSYFVGPKTVAVVLVASGVVMEVLRTYRSTVVVDPVDGSTTLAK